MQCTLGERVCVQRNTKDISNNYTSEGVRVLGLLPPLLQLWPSGGRAPSSPCPMPVLPFPGRQHLCSPVSARSPAQLSSLPCSPASPFPVPLARLAAAPAEACPSLCLAHQAGAKPLLNIKVRSPFHLLQAC